MSPTVIFHQYCIPTQYPFASTEEGGNTRQDIERAVNCIPDFQNSFQGGKLRSITKDLKAKEQFVIRINRDKVLGFIHTRADISASGTQGILHLAFPLSPHSSLPGNISYLGTNGTTGYIIIPFGDLARGT